MKNGYLAKLRTEYARGFVTSGRFHRQLMTDLSVIVLAQDFGFSPEQLLKYCRELGKLHDEYADIFNTDSADTEYSRTKLDDALREVCGPLFVPWEGRYE